MDDFFISQWKKFLGLFLEKLGNLIGDVSFSISL